MFHANDQHKRKCNEKLNASKCTGSNYHLKMICFICADKSRSRFERYGIWILFFTFRFAFACICRCYFGDGILQVNEIACKHRRMWVAANGQKCKGKKSKTAHTHTHTAYICWYNYAYKIVIYEWWLILSRRIIVKCDEQNNALALSRLENRKGLARKNVINNCLLWCFRSWWTN